MVTHLSTAHLARMRCVNTMTNSFFASLAHFGFNSSSRSGCSFILLSTSVLLALCLGLGFASRVTAYGGPSMPSPGSSIARVHLHYTWQLILIIMLMLGCAIHSPTKVQLYIEPVFLAHDASSSFQLPSVCWRTRLASLLLAYLVPPHLASPLLFAL